MDVENDKDVALADALLQLDKAVSRAETHDLRGRLKDVLNLTNPGWRDDEVIVNWVKEKGLAAASESLLKRHLK